MIRKLKTFARLYAAHKMLYAVIEITALCLLIGIFLITSGRALKRIAIQQIAEFTNTNIRTASVNFDFDGSVHIDGLIVEPRERAERSSDSIILRADRVNAHFDVMSLLTFKPRLNHITIDDFEFNAVYDQDENRWNLSAFSFAPAAGSSSAMPSVELNSGKLRYTKISNNEQKVIFEIPVDAKFGFDEKTLAGYNFDITTAKMQGGFGKSNLKGYWQPGRVTLAGGLSSADIAAFEMVWIVNLFAGEIEYDNDKNFTAKLRIKDMANKVRGFDQAHKIDDVTLSKKFGILRVLQNLITQYRPVGRVDLTLAVSGKLDQLKDITILGSVDCKDVSVLHKKFPYQVDQLKGRIDFTETGMSLNHLHGRHDDVELYFDGFAKGFGSDHEYQIQIRSENMLLDENLHNALDSKGKKFWAAFLPGGSAAINYTSMRDSQGKQSALAVELTDASALYKHFPYPLKNLTGTLMFAQNTVTLSDVTSQMGRRKIILNGNVISSPDSLPIYDISIEADNIPMDQTLLDALPKGQKYFYSQYDLPSLFDKDMELYLDARLWTSDQMDRPFYQLLLSLDNIVLSEKIFSVLPKSMKKTIDKLKPKGTINLSAFLNRPQADIEPDYKVTVNCLGNDIELGDTSYPLKDLTGQITVTKDRVVLDDIKATAGDVTQIGVDKPTVKVNGQMLISQKGFTSGSFQLDANDILLNDQLYIALPESAASRYRKVKPKGRFDLNKMNVQAVVDADGKNNFTFSGDGAMKDGHFQNLGVITAFDGKIKNIRTTFRTDKGFGNLDADISDAKLTIKGKTIDSLQTHIFYDKNKKLLQTENFAGKLYGGKIVASFELDALNRQYVLQSGFRGVNLKKFLSDTAPEPNASDGYSTGQMQGTLNVAANLGDSTSRIGRCQLAIDYMQVGKLSPLDKLLIILQLNGPKDYAFDQMIVDSYIKGDNLHFAEIDVSGSALAFTGTGNLNLETENIELVLNGRGKRSAMTKPKGLASLTEGLSQAVLRIEVDGNVYDPKVKTKTLPIIKDAIGLFGKKP